MVKEHEFFKNGLPTIRYGYAVPDDAVNIAFISSPKLSPEENLFISNLGRFNEFINVWISQEQGESYIDQSTNEAKLSKLQPYRIDENIRITTNKFFYKSVLKHETKSSNPNNIKILDVLGHPIQDSEYLVKFIQVSSGNYKVVVYLKDKRILMAEYKAFDGTDEFIATEKLSIEPVNNIKTKLYTTKKLKVFGNEYDVYTFGLENDDIYLQPVSLFGDMKVYIGIERL